MFRFPPGDMVVQICALSWFSCAHIRSALVFRHSKIYPVLLSPGFNSTSEDQARWCCVTMSDPFFLLSLVLFFLAFRLVKIYTQRTNSSTCWPRPLTDNINTTRIVMTSYSTFWQSNWEHRFTDSINFENSKCYAHPTLAVGRGLAESHQCARVPVS